LDGANRYATLEGWVVAEFFACVVDFQEYPTGPIQKDRTRLGGNRLMSKPVEKLVSKFLLKIYNLLT
jgi:hypothetical protein